MEPRITEPFLSNGTVLNGKWEIVEHIATGGKGEVYRARQVSLERDVVLKTISREFLNELGDDEEYVWTEIERFHREAMMMARVRHPNVIQVYDQDRADIPVNDAAPPVQYIVMEYVPGPTLRSVMPDRGFCADEDGLKEWIKVYFLPTLEGVLAIHSLGIIHRDIKPANVLLDGSVPKITDFGIAGGAQWTDVTRSFHVEGTFTYMAPEQFTSLGDTDVRADVYALGKILYEAAEGKLTRQTARPLKSVCLESAETPFRKRLNRIIRDATAEAKDNRTSSVTRFKESLEELLRDFDGSRIVIRGISIPRPSSTWRKILFIITVSAAVLIVVSNLVHHRLLHSPTDDAVTVTTGPEGQPVVPKVSQPAKIIGRDGSTMKRIPSVKTTFHIAPGSDEIRVIDVGPFYIAETEITNAAYVTFLNSLIDRIDIQRHRVVVNGQAWLKLGPVYGAYEPILYTAGRFSVADTSWNDRSVVNVSAVGAAAYANYYGMRLPTEREWLALMSILQPPPPAKTVGAPSPKVSAYRREKTDAPVDVEQVEGRYVAPTRIPYPVFHFPADILGLRGIGSNVGEWGVRESEAANRHGDGSLFVILGGMNGTRILNNTLLTGAHTSHEVMRTDVGFRVVQGTDNNNKSFLRMNDHRRADIHF